MRPGWSCANPLPTRHPPTGERGARCSGECGLARSCQEVGSLSAFSKSTRGQHVNAVSRVAFNTSHFNRSASCPNDSIHWSTPLALPRCVGWLPCQWAFPPVCWQSYPNRTTRFAPMCAASAIEPAPEFRCASRLTCSTSCKWFAEYRLPANVAITSRLYVSHQPLSCAYRASAHRAVW